MKAVLFFATVFTSTFATAHYDQVTYPTELVFRVNYNGPSDFAYEVKSTVARPLEFDWMTTDPVYQVGLCFNGQAKDVFDIVVAMAQASGRYDVTVKGGKLSVDYTSVGNPTVVQDMKIIVPSPYGASKETVYLVRPCDRVTKPQYKY